MFNTEALEAKLATNTRKVQLFTYDSAGTIINRGSGPIGYGDTDVWPIAFVESIDEILTNGEVNHVYQLNRWHYARVVA